MLEMNLSQTKQAPRPLILISVAPPCSPLQPTTAMHQTSLEICSCLTFSLHPPLDKHFFQKSQTHRSHHERSLLCFPGLVCRCLVVCGVLIHWRYSVKYRAHNPSHCSLMWGMARTRENEHSWFFYSYFSYKTSILDILTVSGVLLLSFSQVFLEWEKKKVSFSGNGESGMINKGKPEFSLQSLTGHQYPHQLTIWELWHYEFYCYKWASEDPVRLRIQLVAEWILSSSAEVSFRLTKIAPNAADFVLWFK